MKPREFDELIRQKFDQNDFEYDSRNWERLADQLDGRAKKHSMMMWWLMPLAGVAASVALAMGVPSLLRNTGAAPKNANTEMVQAHKYQQVRSVQSVPVMENEVAGVAIVHSNQVAKAGSKPESNKVTNTIETFSINIDNAISNTRVAQKININLLASPDAIAVKDKKNTNPVNEGYHTFKPEAEENSKPAKVSIILSGGVNHGNQNSGYMAGATIRRMLNDKVYIESDVAFASSTNTQSTEYLASSGSVGGNPSGLAARPGAAARTTSVESSKPSTPIVPSSGTVEEANQSYNLYYAQVTPSLGYQIIKRMSVGVGPDFQQMLVDNRPALSTVDRNNIEVAPTFDIGLMGKTEYALTKKVKAAVCYRKGINNVLTPMDKYIDRDYLQFQVKCTIFNK